MTASPVAQRAWTNHMMFESYHKALLTMKQRWLCISRRLQICRPKLILLLQWARQEMQR